MIHRKVISLFVTVTLIIFFISAQANASQNNMFTTNADDMNGPYLAVYGGSAWTASNQGDTNVTLVAPSNTNRYEVSKSFKPGPILGIQYGYNWHHLGGHSINVSLGVETGYMQTKNLGGLVRPLYSLNPNFDTLDFHYSVSSVPLMLISSVQFPLSSSWTPYVLGGLGVSWNRASDYREIPTDPNSGALPMRSPFRARTMLEFAYTIGAGLSYEINTRVHIGLEYRFTNYGKVSLNPSAQQSTSERLELGKILSNALLLRMSVSLG